MMCGVEGASKAQFGPPFKDVGRVIKWLVDGAANPSNLVLTSQADLRERARMKTLSVILLNYNQAHWLRRSLRAHAEQADEQTEIIVVDDGSTDGSPAVIERLTHIYPAIRSIRHAENKGVAAAIAPDTQRRRGSFCCSPPPTTWSCRVCSQRQSRPCARTPTRRCSARVRY